MQDRSDLKIMATNWGFNGSLNEFCAKVKDEGYDGIEIWWPIKEQDQEELFSALKAYKLEVGFLCGNDLKDWPSQLDHFKKMTEAAATSIKIQPLYINCHSGRDFFSYEENKAFIEHTIQLSKRTGVQVCHETHRSRILFSAPTSRQYFAAFPEMKITLDASHWCTVSESLLDDQHELMMMALGKTEHIHARIGHAEGPQVNDPRAPEWETAVAAHLKWWDQVVKRKKSKRERITFLTEFGPPDYLPTKPYSREPLANQWEINLYMMRLLRNRYS